MNEIERQRIEELLAQVDHEPSLRRRLGRLMLWLIIPTLLIILGVCAARHAPTLTFWAGVAFLIYLSLTAASKKQNVQGTQEHEAWRRDVYLPQWREALAEGNVEVERIEPIELIELITPYPVQVSHVFCLIAEEQVICCNSGSPLFSPDCLYGPQASEWPNTCFEIVTTSRHHLKLGALCLGERLAPLCTDEYDSWFMDADELASLGAVYTGTPRSLVDQIQAIWESKHPEFGPKKISKAGS